MHSYDVVGYTYDGACYCCAGCLPYEAHRDDIGTIYAGDEWDYRPHCDSCGDEIDTALTICGVLRERAEQVCRNDGSTRPCPVCSTPTQIGDEPERGNLLQATECEHSFSVTAWEEQEELDV